MSDASIKTPAISGGLEGYLQIMAWWNAKDLTDKARVVSEDILDGWFEQIVRDEFLGESEEA